MSEIPNGFTYRHTDGEEQRRVELTPAATYRRIDLGALVIDDTKRSVLVEKNIVALSPNPSIGADKYREANTASLITLINRWCLQPEAGIGEVEKHPFFQMGYFEAHGILIDHLLMELAIIALVLGKIEPSEAANFVQVEKRGPNESKTYFYPTKNIRISV